MKRTIALCGVFWCSALLHAYQPRVERLEIFPADRVLHGPGNTQQLAVIAHFADGSKRDITRLTAFRSSDDEIADVDIHGRVRFFRTGEVAVRCRYQIAADVKLAYVEPNPDFAWPKPPVVSLIDHLVYEQLKRLQIVPADLCEDHVFMRRAYIDVCGILPKPEEVRRFMDDRHPRKRSRLIESLIDRPEFAEYWAHFWIDTLDTTWRLDAKNGASLLRWFRDKIQKNTPVDQITRELVLGKAIPTEQGPVTYYRGAQMTTDWADRTSQAFLGFRYSCAQCHRHPDGNWTADDRTQFAAFFAELRMKRVQNQGRWIDVLDVDAGRELRHPITNLPVVPRFPGGAVPARNDDRDRREILAEWLTSPKNPYYARTMVNRIWCRILGKGIADPPERTHELPINANEPLLQALTKSFIAEKYDLKQMVRSICNSRVYQLSGMSKNKRDDTRYFSQAISRHHYREVIHDALCDVTEFQLGIDGMPAGTRAVQVLETYWNRDVFFGGGGRRIAVCTMEEGKDLRSTLHLMSDQSIQNMITAPNNRVGRLLAGKATDIEALEDIFVAAMARLPTTKERQMFALHRANQERRRTFEDVLWAVMNTKEFTRRH